MKKLLGFIAILVVSGFIDTAIAANSQQFAPDLFPITDSRYYLGTTTKAWLQVVSDSYCLTGDSCISTWPTGGGGGGSGGGWATSTGAVIGNFIYNSYGGAVGINSTTPYGGTLTVLGKSGSTTPVLYVGSSTHASFLTVSSAGVTSVINLDGVRHASLFPGADCGAKINAAVANLAASAGTIKISQNCGMTISTAIVAASNQVLEFDCGTWNISALVTAHYIKGCAISTVHNTGNSATVLKQANGANLPILIQINTDNGSISDVEVDGNQANNSGAFDAFFSSNRAVGMFDMYIHDAKRDNIVASSTTSSSNSAAILKMRGVVSYNAGRDTLHVRNATDVFAIGHNEFEGAGRYGILLYNSPGSRIEGSDIATNTEAGIMATGLSTQFASWGLIITGNQFGQNAKEDIYIDGYADGVGYTSYGNTITGNSFWGGSNRPDNTYSAYFSKDSTGNTVTGNSFFASDSTWRYFLEASTTGHSLYETWTGNSFSGGSGTGATAPLTATIAAGNTADDSFAIGNQIVQGALSIGATRTSTSGFPLWQAAVGISVAGVTGNLYNGINAGVAFIQAVDTSGNVGFSGRVSATTNLAVNTATPASTLAVKGSGSTIPLIIASSTDAVMLAVMPNGNVGIATIPTTHKLEVAGGASDDVGLFSSTRNINVPAILTMRHNRGTGNVTNGDLNQFIFQGDTTGAANGMNASIQAVVEDNSSVAGYGLGFSSGGVGATKERIRISAIGNVSVATLTAATIVGTDASKNLTSIASTNALIAGGLVFSYSSATTTTSTPFRVPYSGTITGWQVIGNATCTIGVDVFKSSNAVPTTKISAGEAPTLTAGTYASASTLTGWTTSVSVGDTFAVRASTTPTCNGATIQLGITKN